MSAIAQTQPTDESVFQRAARLMGGGKVLGRRISNALDVHDAVNKGLSAAALHHLIDRLMVLKWTPQLEQAVGISRRTYQRTKEDPKRSLSAEQSGHTWRFAEVLALATDVMGSQELAEGWLDRPAYGLEGRKPLDLLGTAAGAKAVETYLEQIKYGVYV